MRPQTRPFTVEVKTTKRSSRHVGAITPNAGTGWRNLDQPRWSDDGVPEPRKSTASDVIRDASRVFGHAPQRQIEGGEGGANPGAQPPRILPDLLASAREQLRVEGELKTRQSASRPPRLGTPAEAPPVEAVHAKAPSCANEPLNITPSVAGHVEAALRLSGRGRVRGRKLPPGQRWKERRLPRVCWYRRAT